MTRKHPLVRAHDVLAGLIESLTVVLAAVLVVVVTGSVVARYALQIGLLWAEEVSRLAFVWVVFLGSYLALRRRAHLSITVLVDRLPTRARQAVRVVGTLLVLVFIGVIVGYGTLLVLQTWQFGRVTAMLGISAAWGYLAVPVAGVLMFIEVVRQFFEPEPPAAESVAVAAPAVAPDGARAAADAIEPAASGER